MLVLSPRGRRGAARRLAEAGGAGLRRAAGCLAAAVLLLGACTSDFDPYGDGPPYFALDAAIDSRADTLFVRVQDFRVPPGADPAPLDARVTLETLSTGETAVLRDSLTTLDGGGVGHLFWTTATIEGGESYRLRAVQQGDETAASVARFDVPAAAVADTSATEETAAGRRLDLNGSLVRPSPVIVTYDVRRMDTGQTATVAVTYFPFNERNSILISLSADAVRIRNALGLPEDDPPRRAVVTDVRVTYRVRSPVPVSVTDGRGTVVWEATLTADWRAPAAALAAVNLQDGQGG